MVPTQQHKTVILAVIQRQSRRLMHHERREAEKRVLVTSLEFFFVFCFCHENFPVSSHPRVLAEKFLLVVVVLVAESRKVYWEAARQMEKAFNKLFR
jgi:hypothetical protein